MAMINSEISAIHFIESAAYLLRETFEGTPVGTQSVYLDSGVGFFTTLEALTAQQASHHYHGTTVAGHTEHAKFYLDRLCEYINGRIESVNWEDSWLIETVNDIEWDALRAAVKIAYENCLRCIAERREWSESQIGMVMGMIAHTAYHLGAIRQIVKAV